MCLAAAVVIGGPILFVVNWLSPVYEYKGKLATGFTSVQSCMWYMYGALLQQGIDELLYESKVLNNNLMTYLLFQEGCIYQRQIVVD